MTSPAYPIPPCKWYRQPWLLFLLLGLITVLAYQPAWHGEAVFDDTDHLTSPELADAHSLLRLWTEPGLVSQYYPLTHSLFWIQNYLWGHSMFGYHIVNLCFHLLCTFLFWKILQRLAFSGALLAVALFALHPVHAESVAWISELKNTLSTAFYLAAAFAYLHFDQHRQRRHYVAAVLLFIAALLAKSVTASLPAALLVVFWWRRGRLSWSSDVRPLLPFFVLGISSGLFTAWIERHFIGAEGAAFDLSFLQRLLIAGRAFWFYLGKLLWPADLIFIYPRWQISSADTLLYTYPICALLFVAGLWILRTRHRGPLAACLFFVGTLFPVLGFLNIYPFRYSFVADHYAYLASFGVIAAFASGLTALLARWRRPPAFLPALCLIVVITSVASLTWRQSRLYRTPDTLWRATIASNPACFVAHSNLGLHLLQQGQIPAAINHFETARTLRPEFAEIHNNLGNAFRAQGRLDEAIPLYETALRLRPDLAPAHFNLGTVYLEKQQPDRALSHFQKAVALQPHYVAALTNLGSLLIDSGRPADALPHLLLALSLRPTDLDALNNLGNAFLRLDRPTDALTHYQKALALSPSSAITHHNLGCVFLALNNPADATRHFTQATRLRPDFAPSHVFLGNLLLADNHPLAAATHYQTALDLYPQDLDTTCNLAWLLATHPDASVRDGPRALLLAQKADQLSREPHPIIRQILAATYAETGQFPLATDTARHALDLASAQNNTELIALLRPQLAAYQAHTPWRTPTPNQQQENP